MKNRIWLIYIKRLLASSIAAYLVSVAFIYLTGDVEFSEAIRDGIMGFALYFAASIAVSVVNGLGGILYLWADKGSDFEDSVLADLRAKRVPPPDDYHPRTVQYLTEVAVDSGFTPTDRVNAAALAATFSTAQNYLGFFAGIVFASAADRAVLRYSREAPRKRRDEVEADNEDDDDRWDYE